MISGLMSALVPILVRAGVISAVFALIIRGYKILVNAFSRGELSI